MPTFRAGEVAGAAGGVGGDDGGLVIVVGVAALRALLAVGDHRAAFVYDDPACNLYSQGATSGDPGLLAALILSDAHLLQDLRAERAPGVEETVYDVVVILARQG
jgi:hypothetical protein